MHARLISPLNSPSDQPEQSAVSTASTVPAPTSGSSAETKAVDPVTEDDLTLISAPLTDVLATNIVQPGLTVPFLNLMAMPTAATTTETEDTSIITLHYVTNDLTDPIYALEAVYSPKEQTLTWTLVRQSQGSSYGNYVHFYININDPAGTVLANLRDYEASIAPHQGDKAQPIGLVPSTQDTNPVHDWLGGVNLVTVENDDGICLYGSGMAVLRFTTDFTGESVADLNRITMDLKVWSTYYTKPSVL